MAKSLIAFLGIVAAAAAVIYPPYLVPVVNERRWGLIWDDMPGTFGAMHISDHIDWLVLGLELGLVVAVFGGLTVYLARR